MRLLILTQKVDIDDDVLGFFHQWIVEFARHCESVLVICLEQGEYKLPDNVRVMSLGKEKYSCDSNSLYSYLIRRFVLGFNFYKLIWQERGSYDKVFVHMNKEYVVLGGPLWRLWGKQTVLWYNHVYGNIWARLAGGLATKVLFTSSYSFFSRINKSEIMPAGIDTDYIKMELGVEKEANSILCLGRLAPIKNIEVLLDAVEILKNKRVQFRLNIVGVAIERDSEYEVMLKAKVKNSGLSDQVKFYGSVPYRDVSDIFMKNQVYVNLTNSGSLDKTTLEGMSAEEIALVSNDYYKQLLLKQLAEEWIE